MFAGLKMGRVTCTRRNVGSLKEPGSPGQQPARKPRLQSYNHEEVHPAGNLNELRGFFF